MPMRILTQAHVRKGPAAARSMSRLTQMLTLHTHLSQAHHPTSHTLYLGFFVALASVMNCGKDVPICRKESPSIVGCRLQATVFC